MRNLIRVFLLSLLLISFLPTTNGQRSRYVKYPVLKGLSITPKLGINWFFGDLVNARPINFSGGLTVEREMLEYLSARIDLGGGIMSGTQIEPTSGLVFSEFTNTYTTFQVGASFHPIPLIYGYYKQRMFKPYIVGELGIIAFNATETFGEGNGYFAPVGDTWHTTDGFSIAPIATFGGGLNYYINKKFSCNIEWLCGLPFTDMLDAHEEWDSGELGSGQVVKTEGSFDIFWTGTVGFCYTIAESDFRNQFKYNRKSYLKTRKSMTYKKTKSARKFNKTNRNR